MRFKALACLGLNLAVGGAMCAAYDLGERQPTIRRPIAMPPGSRVTACTFEPRAPGCQWPWDDPRARRP